MANNRMRLVCRACQESFPLAKYYPSEGWYINREDSQLAQFGSDLSLWLDQHKHYSVFGNEIGLEFDHEQQKQE